MESIKYDYTGGVTNLRFAQNEFQFTRPRSWSSAEEISPNHHEVHLTVTPHPTHVCMYVSRICLWKGEANSSPPKKKLQNITHEMNLECQKWNICGTKNVYRILVVRVEGKKTNSMEQSPS
jgi:hypothetical protein